LKKGASRENSDEPGEGGGTRERLPLVGKKREVARGKRGPVERWGILRRAQRNIKEFERFP